MSAMISCSSTNYSTRSRYGICDIELEKAREEATNNVFELINGERDDFFGEYKHCMKSVMGCICDSDFITDGKMRIISVISWGNVPDKSGKMQSKRVLYLVCYHKGI
jgi:hypothetical protein